MEPHEGSLGSRRAYYRKMSVLPPSPYDGFAEQYAVRAAAVESPGSFVGLPLAVLRHREHAAG